MPVSTHSLQQPDSEGLSRGAPGVSSTAWCAVLQSMHRLQAGWAARRQSNAGPTPHRDPRLVPPAGSMLPKHAESGHACTAAGVRPQTCMRASATAAPPVGQHLLNRALNVGHAAAVRREGMGSSVASGSSYINVCLAPKRHPHCPATPTQLCPLRRGSYGGKAIACRPAST